VGYWSTQGIEYWSIFLISLKFNELIHCMMMMSGKDYHESSFRYGTSFFAQITSFLFIFEGFWFIKILLQSSKNGMYWNGYPIDPG
jgi:hypothetical protein